MDFRSKFVKFYEGLSALITQHDPLYKGMPDDLEDPYKEIFNDHMARFHKALKDPNTALAALKELQKSCEQIFHVEKAMVASIEDSSPSYPFSGQLALTQVKDPFQQPEPKTQENATPWKTGGSPGVSENPQAANQGNLDGASFSVDNGGGAVPEGPKGSSFEMQKNDDDSIPVEEDPIWGENTDLARRALGSHPAVKIRQNNPVNKSNDTAHAREVTPAEHPADRERQKTTGIRTNKQDRREAIRAQYDKRDYRGVSTSMVPDL